MTIISIIIFYPNLIEHRTQLSERSLRIDRDTESTSTSSKVYVSGRFLRRSARSCGLPAAAAGLPLVFPAAFPVSRTLRIRMQSYGQRILFFVFAIFGKNFTSST